MERKKEQRPKGPYAFMLVAVSLDGKIAPRRIPNCSGCGNHIEASGRPG